MARLYLIGIIVALAVAALIWYLRRNQRKSSGETDKPFTGNVDSDSMPQASSTKRAVGEEWEAQARILVKTGRKIEAIKLVRERTGLDLKSAKDYVERL